MAEHAFWITSRAAGIVALLAASAGGRARPDDEHAAAHSGSATCASSHEALSLATMVALAVHALALLGDGYLSPSLADVTIPFASAYERLWMGVGLVAGWLFVILGLSYYVRGADRRRSAGASCIASPRWPGCSASATRWRWARTPARPGSCSPPRWS